MTSASQISSISLTFNDSWLAYMGSRIYRLAVETIELLGTVFFYPLVQPYSGRRLYQLVDTFCHSASNNDPYNQARINYADDLIKALEGERNIFEKTKRVRTILNTNIIGISILHNKDKQSLSDHVGFTVLPSLIDGFGEEMANRAFLALDELDNESEKNLNQYAKLYRDLTLQQTEIDSFVKMLQELNSNVPREILIHELILARNEHLTDAAKAKITSTLQDGHYIQVKLQRKLELLERLQREAKIKVDEKELTCELKSQRDAQLKTLDYTNPSLFSPEEHAIGTYEDSDETATLESSTTETITKITPTILSKSFESPEMPVGITNTDNSCWYNSALQLLYNTSLFHEIIRRQDRFFQNFPNIAQSLESYQDTYWEQADIRQLEHPSRYGSSQKLTKDIEGYFEKDPNLLKKVRSYRNTRQLQPLDLSHQMQKIRSEIHHKVSGEFKDSGAGQEDSKQFLFNLLQKLGVDVAQTITKAQDIYDLTSKYVFFHKLAPQTVNVEELLFATNYVIEAILIHSGTNKGGHYYAAIRRNQNWYLCNDSFVQKISEKRLQQELQNNSAFIMATEMGDFEENLAVQPQDSTS